MISILTSTIRDAFTKEVCQDCDARDDCPKDMENQCHCAALLTWKAVQLLHPPRKHLTHNPGILSSSSEDKAKFVNDQCGYPNCKYRRTCETNGYICPAVIRVNKLE